MVGLVRGDLWRLLSSFWRRLVHIADAILDSILKCCRVVLKAVQVFEQRDRYEQLRVIMLVVKSSGGRMEMLAGKWPVERHRRDQAWLKVSL